MTGRFPASELGILLQLVVFVFNYVVIFSPGMNKMVINQLEKLLVTNDAATILRELEVRLDYLILCFAKTFLSP